MSFAYSIIDVSQYNSNNNNNYCCYQTNNSDMASSINNTGNASNGRSRKNKHLLDSNLAPLDNRPLKRHKTTEGYFPYLPARQTLADEFIGSDTADVIRQGCFPDDDSDIPGSIDRYHVGIANIFNDCVFFLKDDLTKAECSILKHQVFTYQPLTEEEHWCATYGPNGVKPIEETLAQWGHLSKTPTSPPATRIAWDGTVEDNHFDNSRRH
ncbi:hypothetical protein F5X99DRAFT_366587 [Biscogniauxia marginata]|nr:hypothetical protein F5X99DRAFT_366587 [Biscogniauxia marginata]